MTASRILALGGACLALIATQAHAQATSECTPPTCTELRKFDVTVADFQTSKAGHVRLVSTTLRFRNRSDKPLILGYVRGSGLSTDDRGNRYALHGAVRGMGEITTNEFDPKFVLEPGAISEARFEFSWQPTARDIYGTAYDLDLAIREIDPVTSSQYKLGLEHALRFRKLTTEVVAGARAAPVAKAAEPKAAEPKAAAPPPEPVDPCGSTPRCTSAGPFTANIVNVTPSMYGGRHHVLAINVRFRNVSSEPIILGYSGNTSGAVDNAGNRYYYGRAGTHDTSVKGMGIVTARSADPQFVLQPGQSRNATFQVVRFNSGAANIGTDFSYDVAVEQLEVLASRQVRSLRQYTLNFPSIMKR